MLFPSKNSMTELVETILQSARDGRLTTTRESQRIDFKEEAGRRNGRHIEPGEETNPEAAVHLADEAACMANTPGGGALIVGVEDRTGKLIGTQLDEEWLRHQIYRQTDIAPDIQPRIVDGQRLLVIYVPEAREPVENSGGNLKWRVGDNCESVDRAKWWEHRERRNDEDIMAKPSEQTIADVRPYALEIVRGWADADDTVDDEAFLRNIGALRSDGALTRAASLLLCGGHLNRPSIEITEFDVPGGSIKSTTNGNPARALAEDIAAIEAALESMNTFVTLERGFSHEQSRRVPQLAAREAILNAVIHRDWHRSEPTEISWYDLDSMLVVRSPGGFVGQLSAATVLSNRAARYPALSDLFRAIGLVDKRGVGVDRMYQTMIVRGFHPPLIEEKPGPSVECSLQGGEPSLPIMSFMHTLVPEARHKDHRIAIIIYALLHEPFITAQSLAGKLQVSEDQARYAIRAAEQTTSRAHPIIAEMEPGVWILSEPARQQLKTKNSKARQHEIQNAHHLLYISTASNQLSAVTESWLEETGRITTGQLATLTGVSRGTAKRFLDSQVDDGEMIAAGAGRSAHYRKN